MTLSIADFIAVVSLFISLMVAAFNVIKIIKDNNKTKEESNKIKVETEKTIGADTTKVYAEAAKMVADQNIDLRTRIDYLEKRVDELCDLLRTKNDRIVELEQLLESQEIRIKELENEIAMLKKVNNCS